MTLVDLGCGDGPIIYSLYKNGLLNRFNKVIGVDISVERIRIANKNIKFKGCSFILSGGNVVNKIKNGTVDFLISNQVIEHVKDDSLMLKEISRIVKKGGIAYISTVFKKRFGWYFYKNYRGEWVIDPTHEIEYTSNKQLLPKIKKVGFNILSETKTLQWFPITDFILKRVGFNQNIYENNLFWGIMRKIKLPIIGYYNWEIVCKKS